jgi:hypothetical protein
VAPFQIAVKDVPDSFRLPIIVDPSKIADALLDTSPADLDSHLRSSRPIYDWSASEPNAVLVHVDHWRLQLTVSKDRICAVEFEHEVPTD